MGGRHGCSLHLLAARSTPLHRSTRRCETPDYNSSACMMVAGSDRGTCCPALPRSVLITGSCLAAVHLLLGTTAAAWLAQHSTAEHSAATVVEVDSLLEVDLDTTLGAGLANPDLHLTPLLLIGSGYSTIHGQCYKHFFGTRNL